MAKKKVILTWIGRAACVMNAWVWGITPFANEVGVVCVTDGVCWTFSKLFYNIQKQICISL